ncbi:hypothetical protein ASG27_00295 [Acidovorax sp. Leaf191]|uniref:hypothetical protein n=1 Tax=Acidovorax sp. Leaf191 TaxID=1736296 RepID=UPI0006FF7EE3|nr:hypothetical protein [Acidovorax sp. Leaf191]KQS42290.1 hypothetical protein ASG27_00295 [Acidovorax sp. Leaf191]
MNKTARFLSIAAVSAFAAFGAHADEADASQFALVPSSWLVVRSARLGEAVRAGTIPSGEISAM